MLTSKLLGTTRSDVSSQRKDSPRNPPAELGSYGPHACGRCRRKALISRGTSNEGPPEDGLPVAPTGSVERAPIVGEFELSQTAQHWVNVTLIRVGFGTLAGLLARLLIPGREPSGAVGTVLIGIVGSVIGPLSLCFFLNRGDFSLLSNQGNFNPISPLGFLAAAGGALVTLVGYRMLVALVVVEQEEDRG